MKRLFLCSVLIVCALPLHADVPDSVWNALVDREVVVGKLDGSRVEGTLIGVADTDITVMREDGRLVTVLRSEVEDVRGVSRAPAPAATEQREDAPKQDYPLGSSYFLFDPLGFLQVGPVLEYGFLVGTDLYVAPRIRLLGLGVVSQALSGWEMKAYSLAAGIGVTRMFPTESANRVYGGGTVEFGVSWYEGEDSWESWEGNTGLLILSSNAGYQWRYPSRFFLRFGGFAGVGIELWDRWWYTDDPDEVYKEGTAVYFVFGLQFTLGWEQGD